jgi:hypothetical protein
MTHIAIVQSNYIPWRGYFALIAAVDRFVLYDDMQYTRRDWRNRNRIKTPHGAQWLSVPVQVKGRYTQRIRDTLIDGHDWAGRHWKALQLNYKRAAGFDATAAWLEPLYRTPHTHLSALNRMFIEAVCRRLDIDTCIDDCCDYRLQGGRSERLASICEQAGASVYLSGPAARGYLDEAVFARRGIAVQWFGYEGLVPYPQLWGAFEPQLSVLDLLLNCGADARQYLRPEGGP